MAYRTLPSEPMLRHMYPQPPGMPPGPPNHHTLYSSQVGIGQQPPPQYGAYSPADVHHMNRLPQGVRAVYHHGPPSNMVRVPVPQPPRGSINRPRLHHNMSHPTIPHSTAGHHAPHSHPLSGHPSLRHQQPGPSPAGPPGHHTVSHPAHGRPILGHPAHGHPAPGIAVPSHVPAGHPTPGHPTPGHPAPGHPAPSHPSTGHPALGHPAPGHQAPGHSAPLHAAHGLRLPGQPASMQSHPGQLSTGHPTPGTPVHQMMYGRQQKPIMTSPRSPHPPPSTRHPIPPQVGRPADLRVVTNQQHAAEPVKLTTTPSPELPLDLSSTAKAPPPPPPKYSERKPVAQAAILKQQDDQPLDLSKPLKAGAAAANGSSPAVNKDQPKAITPPSSILATTARPKGVSSSVDHLASPESSSLSDAERDLNNAQNVSSINSLIGNHPIDDILYLHCVRCQCSYGSVHSFRKHFRNSHGYMPSSDDVLIQSIKATKAYVMHKNESSAVVPRRHCTYCGWQCEQTNPSAFSRHMKEHYDVKGCFYRCVHCNADFGEPNTLRQHIVNHTGVYQYICSYCCIAYSLEEHLADHMFKQHGMTYAARRQNLPVSVVLPNPATHPVSLSPSKISGISPLHAKAPHTMSYSEHLKMSSPAQATSVSPYGGAHGLPPQYPAGSKTKLAPYRGPPHSAASSSSLTALRMNSVDAAGKPMISAPGTPQINLMSILDKVVEQGLRSSDGQTTADGLPAPQVNSLAQASLARRHSIATVMQYKPMPPSALRIPSPKKPPPQQSPAIIDLLHPVGRVKPADGLISNGAPLSRTNSTDLNKQQKPLLADVYTKNLTNATTINPNFHYSDTPAGLTSASSAQQPGAGLVNLTKNKLARQERNIAPSIAAVAQDKTDSDKNPSKSSDTANDNSNDTSAKEKIKQKSESVVVVKIEDEEDSTTKSGSELPMVKSEVELKDYSVPKPNPDSPAKKINKVSPTHEKPEIKDNTRAVQPMPPLVRIPKESDSVSQTGNQSVDNRVNTGDVTLNNSKANIENSKEKETTESEFLTSIDLSTRGPPYIQPSPNPRLNSSPNPQQGSSPLPENACFLINNIIDEVVKSSLGVTMQTAQELADNKRRLDALTDAIVPPPAPPLHAVTPLPGSDNEAAKTEANHVLPSTPKPAAASPQELALNVSQPSKPVERKNADPIPVSWTVDPNKESEEESVEVDPLKAMAACRVLLVPHEYENEKTTSAKEENDNSASSTGGDKSGQTTPTLTATPNTSMSSTASTSFSSTTVSTVSTPSTPVSRSNSASNISELTIAVTTKRKYLSDSVQTDALDMSCKKSQNIPVSADSDISMSPKRLKIVE